MYKRLLYVLFMGVLTLPLTGQNLTTSPYSYFGIGDIERIDNGQTSGMGGTGIGINNKYHLNLENPASYSTFDTLSFKFEFGAKSKLTTFSTSTLTEKVDDHGLSYLAMGFPITKRWHSTIGLLPMSSVGFHIVDNIEDDYLGLINYQITGEGGLNQLVWGNSFKINESIALGINTSYVFGRLSYFNALLLPNQSSTINSISENKLTIKGFNYRMGVQYSKFLNNNKLTVGLILENKSKVSVIADTLAGTSYQSWFDYIDNYSIVDTITMSSTKGNIQLPMRFGFGLSYTDQEHYIAAFDFEFQKWKDTEILGKNAGLNNQTNVALGLEYVPSRNHPKFFRRLHYRIGGNYSNTYLNINNNQLNQYGITFGIGIPVRRTKTSFNINFEYGQRGTTEYNLIKENYAIISLNLSLSDIWFYQRKYD